MHNKRFHILFEPHSAILRIVGLFALGFSLIFLLSIGIGIGVMLYNGMPQGLMMLMFLFFPLIFMTIGIKLTFGREVVALDTVSHKLVIVSSILFYKERDLRVSVSDIESVNIKKETRVRHTKNGTQHYEMWMLSVKTISGEFNKITESADELQIRRYSELISKAVFKSIIDETTEPATVRKFDELDIPVADKLRTEQFDKAHALSTEFPVKETKIGSDTVFMWKESNLIAGMFMILFGFIFLSGPLAGLVTLLTTLDKEVAIFLIIPLGMLSLVAFAGFVVIFTGFYFIFGECTLTISHNSVRKQYILFIPTYSVTLLRDKIEEIRIGQRLGGGPSVELISDEKSISISAFSEKEKAQIFANRIKTVFVYDG